jgi:hypothetical protein
MSCGERWLWPEKRGPVSCKGIGVTVKLDLPSRRGGERIASVSMAAALILMLVFSPNNTAAQAYTNSFIYSFNPAVSKISLAPGTREGLFRESDSITISTSDNSPIRVSAIDGALVYSGTPTSLQLVRGHYFVECNGDRNQFAVLPDDYAGASFLGTEADLGTDSQGTERLAQIQPAWVRVMGPSDWDLLEPQRGVWNWGPLDTAVAANQGRQIILMAFVRPDWVGDAEFVPQFVQYVQAMASRYTGQVRAIEIWNEPWYQGSYPYVLPGTNWVQMLQYYMGMLQSARAAVKSVSSSIQVFGPAWQSSYWTDAAAQFVQFGGGSLVDCYTYHDYSMNASPPDQDTQFSPSVVVKSIDKRVADLRAAGLGNGPLMMDEGGLFGLSSLGCTNFSSIPGWNSNLNWHRGMCRAIKYLVMYRGAGAQAVLPHVLALYSQYPDENWEVYGWDYSPGTSQAPRGPHPKTSAFLMACYWLNGATLADYRTPGQQVYLYAWQRTNNTSVVFAWAVEGPSVPLNNNALAATDIYGKSISVSSLTEEPVLFQSSSLSPSALLSNVMAALPNNLNLPPVFPAMSDQAVLRGQLLQFAVSATDPNHSPLTYSASPMPAGASLNPSTGAFSWTPTTSQIGSYPLTFTATDDQGMSASTSITITVTSSLMDGLAHYWDFDEASGTTANDSAGACSGTLEAFSFNSSDGWVPGVIGTALEFDGVKDSVYLNNNLILTNNFSISTWVRPENASGTNAFLAIHSHYQASGLRFFVAGNALLMQGQTTAGWQANNFASGAIQNNVWHQLAIVYDRSTLTVYVDGVNQGSTNWGGDIVMNPLWPSNVASDEGGYFFQGAVDELMIYNRTLGPQEVLELYQAPHQPPTFTALGSQSVQPGQPLAFTVSATDANGIPVDYSASSLPAGASFDPATQLFTWATTSSQTGDYTVTFTASSALSVSSAEQVSISVTTTPPSPAVTSPQLLPGGSFQVTFHGVIGSNYTFQASSDMKNWISLFGFTCTNSPMYLMDTNAMRYACRYYRVAQLGATPAFSLGFGCAQPWTTNGLSLMLQGPLGSNYIIQASTDLVNWQAITNFVPTTSPFYFSDPAATNYNRRFYRGVMP